MNCPACGIPLEEERTSSYRIFQCPKCKGGWFDPGELVSYVKVTDAGKAPLYLDFSSRLNTSTYPRERPGPEQRPCPRCEASLEEANYAYNSNIMVDKCPACEGVWLDGGEFPMVAQFLRGSEIFRERASSLAENLAAPEPSPGLLPLWLSGAAAVLYTLFAMHIHGGLPGLAYGVYRMPFCLALIWVPALTGSSRAAGLLFVSAATYRIKEIPAFFAQIMGWILMAYFGWELWWLWKHGLS
ncbi:hypothetical protein Dalk_3653 [Desulfatibacillum aliphaticivorans]|uniref:Transcription factor zinc-finger domain-containing protein n=1 Tax=Desulfatibacillum aliphaticivorans TaxID=218208 RepID=B8FGW1_DESAL|nr:zf-TFIIB domain-containing protein [Desulfatibacillum aliphaticivorans]ACL05341.1 hypothetical protein Dalk_3653 [Desulfatibacillum aliphaticivorans]